MISVAIIAVVGVVVAAVYMKKNGKKPNIGQEGTDTQLMDEEETFEVDKPKDTGRKSDIMEDIKPERVNPTDSGLL